MTTMKQENDCSEILIIGGGPAGMFAAFYGGMRQATVKLIESMPQLGGQLASLYPEKFIYDVAGFPKITAQELVNNLSSQMKLFHTDIRLKERVESVQKMDDRHFIIRTDKGEHHAKTVIITAGVGAFEPRRLDIERADIFEDRNLHYFIDDLHRFQGKKILITGGGDSAVDWALMLEPIAKQVHLVHRRDKFRAHEHSVEKLYKSNVNVIVPSEVTELHGDDQIDRVILTDVKTKEKQVIEVDDLIVNFGFVSTLGPISDWGIAIENHSILVNSRMETSVSGIFAAGDITTYPGKVKLIAVGFGEAPTAVNNAKVYMDPNARLAPGHSSNRKL